MFPPLRRLDTTAVDSGHCMPGIPMAAGHYVRTLLLNQDEIEPQTENLAASDAGRSMSNIALTVGRYVHNTLFVNQDGIEPPSEESAAADARRKAIRTVAARMTRTLMVDRFLRLDAADVHAEGAPTVSAEPLYDDVCRQSATASVQRPWREQVPQPVLPDSVLLFAARDTFELPQMLDAAGVVVRAVYDTMPASIVTWVEQNRNPRSRDGQYRAIKRFCTDHGRKSRLCDLFRRFYCRQRSEHVNRQPGEPLREYLSSGLLVLAVRQLLWEIRERRHGFGGFLPKIQVGTEEYVTWFLEATQRVEEHLDMQHALIPCKVPNFSHWKRRRC